jgi:hypothetical protein
MFPMMFFSTGIHPERATMNWHPVQADNAQANRLAQPQQRGYREIAKVFMIDSVVFQTVQEFPEVRDFNNDQAVVLEQLLASQQEVLSLIYVGQNVVTNDCAGRTVSRPDLAGSGGIEELLNGLDAVGTGHFSYVGSWLDA